ncbi:histone acetyltransferase catalytic subunit HAT1 [Ascoidea rubescens DSM 1968]|uniref:Histone acetyltransferase type B catalytic subunit n=1 Tax=Ascoidea rubescens DSM 1968 TaxID=1344418 RepID=A0A1D2VR76_9ASCO|nr:histone acetyltransferase type B catalytic subunit [Ascoidea rubescens DSM 1968]ODV64100.1 histone acetyltransferase type B catalytic subunit [Ascoidea rubescens DSM 1968]
MSDLVGTFSPELWTCSSTKSLIVSIDDTNGCFKFNPIFTYPIFGDAEQIFGYKNLKIELKFDSINYLPFLEVKFDEKLNNKQIEDPVLKLKEFLPSSVIVQDENKWIHQSLKENELASKDNFIDNLLKELVKIHEYENNGKQYELFKGKLKNLRLLEFHKRIQIFVLLFIEAGSYIDENDDNWDYYFLFERQSSQLNKLVGFCTAYSYWKYPGFKEYDNLSESQLLENKFYKRIKISQFLILPPYQNQRHGFKLYNSLFDYWFKDEFIQEITIEDPSERFDDLRDKCDLIRLSSTKINLISSKNLNFAKINSSNWLADKQRENKMEKRQFLRCIEMGLVYWKQRLHLSERELRLFVKRRLYEKNKDALDSLEDPSERKNLLEIAYERVKKDYERLLEGLELENNKRSIDES